MSTRPAVAAARSWLMWTALALTPWITLFLLCVAVSRGVSSAHHIMSVYAFAHIVLGWACVIPLVIVGVRTWGPPPIWARAAISVALLAPAMWASFFVSVLVLFGLNP